MKTPPKTKAKLKDDDPLAGDLSELIGKGKWRKVNFVFAPKDATVTIRMPRTVLDAARKLAQKRGIKYHRMMRDAIVSLVAKAA